MSPTACVDSSDRFLVPGSGGNDMRTCDWIIRNNPGNQTIPWRCNAYPEAAAHCPVTCGLCPCVDNPDQFLIATYCGGVKLTCDCEMRDNPGNQVIPYRCNIEPKAEENC